jgi:hypothetical protein
MNWRVVSILVLNTVIVLTPGCAYLPFMNSKIPETCLATCAKLHVAPTDFILTVSIEDQSVGLFEDTLVCDRRTTAPSAPDFPAVTNRRYTLIKKFPCSTSRFGIGQIEGSNCTPLGLHRIGEKIGAGVLPGTVFKSREIIGHTSQPEFSDAKITTRILWLDGLEPGFNRDGNVDSHRRYIYIHGTGDQGTIGQPSSCGCIHLSDANLVWLFDRVPVGTLVWITER